MKYFKLTFDVTERFEYVIEAETYDEACIFYTKNYDQICENMTPVYGTYDVMFLDAEEIPEKETLQENTENE
jgi:hypothetical protein